MPSDETLAGMQLYGAEDAEELAAILDALHRADGERLDEVDPRGQVWDRVLRELDTFWEPEELTSADIPARPGIYVWFYRNEPVYVGAATGKRGLRGRLRAHLATGTDLSRSTFRASVAVKILWVERSVARMRPSVLTVEQVARVNIWVGQCEVAWLESDDAHAARDLERRLRTAWLPPLNIA